jgi:hypothetical protein
MVDNNKKITDIHQYLQNLNIFSLTVVLPSSIGTYYACKSLISSCDYRKMHDHCQIQGGIVIIVGVPTYGDHNLGVIETAIALSGIDNVLVLPHVNTLDNALEEI